MIDSHCHLDYFTPEEVDGIIAACEQGGVKILQTISTKMSKFEDVLEFTKKFENVYCSVGVHPLECSNEPIVRSDELVECINSHQKIIGIGETGLDYFKCDSEEEKLRQKESFREHIIAASLTGLPLIIHCRDADDDVIALLEEAIIAQKNRVKFLIHCFTGSKKFADRVLELGGYISFSGIITFKNATDLQEIAKTIPLDRIFIETDAPYLAPVPMRGKRNFPQYVKYVAAYIAELKSVSPAVVSDQTTQNFLRVFDRI